MSGLKTWTVRFGKCCVVVTAETIEQAREMIDTSFGLMASNAEFIPLPTHHRYARKLDPLKIVDEL